MIYIVGLNSSVSAPQTMNQIWKFAVSAVGTHNLSANTCNRISGKFLLHYLPGRLISTAYHFRVNTAVIVSLRSTIRRFERLIRHSHPCHRTSVDTGPLDRGNRHTPNRFITRHIEFGVQLTWVRMARIDCTAFDPEALHRQIYDINMSTVCSRQIFAQIFKNIAC